jgi:predicted transcriptional regulator
VVLVFFVVNLLRIDLYDVVKEIKKVQLINVNSKMRKNLFYFLTKKGRTFPLVKISFFERY